MGRIYPMENTESNPDEKIEQLKRKVESMGFACHIGG